MTIGPYYEDFNGINGEKILRKNGLLKSATCGHRLLLPRYENYAMCRKGIEATLKFGMEMNVE